MSTVGYGVAPARPVDPGVVSGLFGDRIAQSALWAKATQIAPIITVAQTSGTLPIAGTYRGVDLSVDPKMLTEKASTGDVYGDAAVKFDDESYRLKRYTLPKFDLSNLDRQNLMADNGIEMEDEVARFFADATAARHWQQIASAISTAANYASGYSADGGDITSAAFDLIGLCDTAGNKLIDGQAWAEGNALDVFISQDCVKYIQKNTQVRDRLGTNNSTFITGGMIGEWFAEYMPGARVTIDSGRYKAADGAITRTSSGVIAFSVPRDGKFGRGNLCTLALQSDGAPLSDLRTEDIPGAAKGGTRFYCDAFYDVHQENINDANSTSGYLAHTLLS